MIVPRFIAGFAGHRDLKNPQVVKSALTTVWNRLKGRMKGIGGELEVYASAAYGADRLAIQTARAAALPVHIILPKQVTFLSDTAIDPAAGFALDFWVPRSGEPNATFLREEWLNASRIIIDARAGKDGGSLRFVQHSDRERDCYYHAGVEIVDHCDVLVVVWDGLESRGLGGTGDIVAHARAIEKPIVIVSPTTGEIVEERPESFGQESEAGLVVVRELNAFISECGGAKTGESRTSAEIFNVLETCSNRHSAQFRNQLVRIIVVHGVATGVAAIACILPHASSGWKAVLAFLALAEFGMVAWALWRMANLKRHHIHERWIKSRFATELLRSMSSAVHLVDPLKPLIVSHDRAWRRFALSLGMMMQRESRPESDWENARDRYIAERLRDQEITKGQIKFFQEKQALAERFFRRTARWSRVFTASAAVFLFFAVLYKGSSWLSSEQNITSPEHSSTAKEVLVEVSFRLMPIVLPLAAGVLISLGASLDSARRTHRYRELAEFLEKAASRLAALKTEAAVRMAIEEIEEVLLDELVEWRLAEQQNSNH